MIAEYLDHEYMLTELRAQLDSLKSLERLVREKDPEALGKIRKEGVSRPQIARAIKALKVAVSRAKKTASHANGAPYIPSEPVTCGIQQGLTQIAVERSQVEPNPPAKQTRGVRGPGAGQGIDTSPPLRLRKPATRGGKPARRGAKLRGGEFIEGKDPYYALDGFAAKFGALFVERREFNPDPAKVAATSKPLSLFIFGDWGTGLGLAQEVTRQIGIKLEALDETRQSHVIHLGDVYYVGEPKEYKKRALPYWPVKQDRASVTGSWSLNGNHDMYSGGHGYFDTLLRHDMMIRWHGDAHDQPSSFFLIEDADWQVFGLDTSWDVPSLGSVIFDKPTLGDYGGQNGTLTDAQVNWMAKMRDTKKGCILLTHHQPASSRSEDKQHSDDAIKSLKAKGVYRTIDAWIWGHEHRCVVFKPKAERKNAKLKEAPDFCACVGHGGVPVPEKNFNAENRIADVLWEEDRFDNAAPIYDNVPVVPFGFASIDTGPGAFTFRVFDHTGDERYKCVVKHGATLSVAPEKTTRAKRTKRTRKGKTKRGR